MSKDFVLGFVRLFGAINFVGAATALWRDHWRWGWFWTPSVVLGLALGIPLVFLRPWARRPAILLCFYWLLLGLYGCFRGLDLATSMSVMGAGVGCLPVLLVWSQTV